MRDIHSPVTATLRLVAFLIWTALFMSVYTPLLALRKPLFSRWMAQGFWWVHARIFGFRVITRGERSPTRPTLYVSNHLSYFDIIVLGSVIRSAFVAKSEVGTWPLFGLIAKLGGTVFVDRKRQSSGTQRDKLRDHLAGPSGSLILFPEGTSGDGTRVLPFKSALFAAANHRSADGSPLIVQPISLTYTRLDGMPLGRLWRPMFAWYGDMELLSHIWIAAGLGRVTVEVEFHPPVKIDMFGSRKAMADHCEKQVRVGVDAAKNGRPSVAVALTAA